MIEVDPKPIIKLLQERISFANIKRVRLCKESGYYRRNSIEVDLSVATRERGIELWLLFYIPVYLDEYTRAEIADLVPNPHAIHHSISWELYLNKPLKVFEASAKIQMRKLKER